MLSRARCCRQPACVLPAGKSSWKKGKSSSFPQPGGKMTKLPIFIYYGPCSQQIKVPKFRSLSSFLCPGDRFCINQAAAPVPPHGARLSLPQEAPAVPSEHRAAAGGPGARWAAQGCSSTAVRVWAPSQIRRQTNSKWCCLYKHHKQLF